MLGAAWEEQWGKKSILGLLGLPLSGDKASKRDQVLF